MRDRDPAGRGKGPRNLLYVSPLYDRIELTRLDRMKSFKQPSLNRRGLLQAGAGLLGAAAFGLAMPRTVRAETIQAAQLSEADKADIARVEGYLNSVSTMKASFQQFTESEGLAFGRIYLRRPGRLRVEYDPPSEILLIADGTLLSYSMPSSITSNRCR